MNGGAINWCVECSKHTFVSPLHDDKGGPLMCPICAGKWHAKHGRRRKWGRIIIKAMKFYEREGGLWADFDKLKLAATGLIDPLEYGADTLGAEIGDITAELLADTIQLTHPDKHPPEREEMAKRVTQELLALKPYVFPAPKPEPATKLRSRNAFVKVIQHNFTDPSQPKYPCEACVDTVTYFYCDACRAEKERRRQEEREKQNAKQRKWYADRHRWRKWR